MFKNIWSWILLRVGALARLLEKPAEVANQVVNIIKDYVFNPVVDIFTSMTRTGIDNTIILLLRQHLPGVMKGMLLAGNVISDLTKGDIGSLLRVFAEFMKSLQPAGRTKWWIELAGLLLPLISKRDLPMAVSVSVTQGTYLKGYPTLTA